MNDGLNANKLLSLTTKIVAAHVGNNEIALERLPDLIGQVYHSLTAISDQDEEPLTPGRPQPAVPIRKSITADTIICLEDGKRLKTLKRYLKTTYNMTPAEYRERWGLPFDYPMVAPSYAKHRSELAKTNGLGTREHRNRPTETAGDIA